MASILDPRGEQQWEEVRAFLGSVFADQPRAGYLLAIIDDVLAIGADEVLAMATSMHDLVIAPKPMGDPRVDVVVVRAPSSLAPAAEQDLVRIDHLSASGRSTSIERPRADAVALFWRFMREEFGIQRSEVGGTADDEPTPTTIHCPRCGAVMEEIEGVLTCVPGEMQLSEVMRGLLVTIVAEGLENPPAPYPGWRGVDWHCPADGAHMADVDGRISCLQCGRSMQRGTPYMLVTLHPHRPVERRR